MIGFKKAFASIFFVTTFLLFSLCVTAQLIWTNVNSAYTPLPDGFNVFETTDSLDGKPFKAFYAIADLKNKNLK